MSQYFSAFPYINYSGINAKNITLRANISNSFKQISTNFYNYTIKDGETADALAFDYYGDPNYIWAIYLANNIIDPYYEWPLSSIEFDNFIINKYGSTEAARNTISYYKKIPVDYYVNTNTNAFILASLYDPLVNGYNWTKVTIDDDIKNSNDPNFSIITESNLTLITESGTKILCNNLLNLDTTVWQEVDAYTDELEQNENKRYIKLLDNSLISVMDRQLKEIMNG
jgi:hypothetical protein